MPHMERIVSENEKTSPHGNAQENPLALRPSSIVFNELIEECQSEHVVSDDEWERVDSFLVRLASLGVYNL